MGRREYKILLYKIAYFHLGNKSLDSMLRKVRKAIMSESPSLDNDLVQRTFIDCNILNCNHGSHHDELIGIISDKTMATYSDQTINADLEKAIPQCGHVHLPRRNMQRPNRALSHLSLLSGSVSI